MSWRHLGDVIVKRSRKHHQCFLCGGEIVTGYPYLRRSGAQDGQLESFAMHTECEAVTRTWDIDRWECFEHGSMKRGIDEER